MLLVGPTSVGKTGVAEKIAREYDFDLVNTDKYILYANDFPLATGGSDSLKIRDVRLHLYGILKPQVEPPTPEEFLEKIIALVDTITGEGRKALLEGCSVGYNTALIQSGAPQIQPIIGLEWRNPDRLLKQIKERVEKAFIAGLVEETGNALSRGLGDTCVMKKSYVYERVLKYLSGEISLEECKDRVCNKTFDAAHQQLEIFRKCSGIQWVQHDPSDTESTLKSIRAIMAQNHLC